MDFKLVRSYQSTATPGELFDSAGNSVCYTIERAKDDPDHPAVSEGVKTLIRYNSPKHGSVWMIKDEPGRSYIEMHIVSTVDYVRPAFLLGCIGLGDVQCTERGETAVCQSHDAFKRWMDLTEGEDELTLTITS